MKGFETSNTPQKNRDHETTNIEFLSDSVAVGEFRFDDGRMFD